MAGFVSPCTLREWIFFAKIFGVVIFSRIACFQSCPLNLRCWSSAAADISRERAWEDVMQKAPKAAPWVLSLLASAPSQQRLNTKCSSRFYLRRDYLTSVFPVRGGNGRAGRMIRALYFQFSALFQARSVLCSCGPLRGRSEGSEQGKCLRSCSG